MKILYHHRTASRDGQSTHIQGMIRGLRSIGCEVDEAAPSLGEDKSSGGSAGWVGKVKKWVPKPFYELAELAYSFVAYRRLVRCIRSTRPDAIYERYNLFLLAGIWAKRRHGLPLILEVNSPMVLERQQYGGLHWPRLAGWAEGYVWRNADAILPVTHVMAQHLVARGVEPTRITVIPNGIDVEHYSNLPSVESAKSRLDLSGKFVIGFIGFVREWDQLDRIVRWIARRPDDGRSAHLLIVGDGPARDDTERCARELGISDRLTFTGAVAREAVPALAMAFDVALQTALVPYASPICLFEYLALSKAIVAPDQPNHHEILRAGDNCILYDPDDPNGIEKALDLLCTNDALRTRIALGAGQVIAAKALTWKDHASSVVRVASRLVKSPPTSTHLVQRMKS